MSKTYPMTDAEIKSSLERENAQLKAVIEQQKEVIITHGKAWLALNNKNQEQSALIETLAEALKAMVGYDRERGCGLLIADEALQQYELWKESK